MLVVTRKQRNVGALALDRRMVRRRFEERFSAARMARDYVRIYRSMLRKQDIPEDAAEVSLPESSLLPPISGAKYHEGVAKRAADLA